MDGPVAIFSDVHANLEALEAVLADARAHGAARHVCLGDVVGYGPDPETCTDRIRSLGCPVVLGNHDQAAADKMMEAGLNDYALAGLAHTRRQLSPENLTWLAGLPFSVRDADMHFAHGSVDERVPWDYILSEAACADQFRHCEARLIFLGHTHQPALWQLTKEGVESIPPAGTIHLADNARYLVNVGSVGQPRNLRPEACYVLYHPGTAHLEFRYVKYPWRRTMRKIQHAGLPMYLGQRLGLGR